MSDATTEDASQRKRASVRTRVESPNLVAAALRPDNTEEMHTRVMDGTVETTIHRPSTGGLRTTLDDYVCNLSVATAVIETASSRMEDGDGTTASGGETDGESESERVDHGDTNERASTDEHLPTDNTDIS